MKLVQINEVFEKPNLDGVQVEESFGVGIYYFKDESTDQNFEVKVYPNRLDESIVNPAHREAFVEIRKRDREIKQEREVEVVQLASVFLSVSAPGEAEANRYGETGQGNQWFVYGKLIACMHHYIGKYKPLGLMFSGATRSMDLVYDKFIRMSQRLYPEDAYVPYSGELYLRKDVVEKLPDSDAVTRERENRDQKLQRIRQTKNAMRKRDNRRVSSWDSADTSNPGGSAGEEFDPQQVW